VSAGGASTSAEATDVRADIAIAGAVAGFVSETLLHPFDTVSHRAKVSVAAVRAVVLLSDYLLVSGAS
jgi:hypothetical protein